MNRTKIWLIFPLLSLLAASMLLCACKGDNKDDKKDVPVVTWQKTFGGLYDDEGYSVQQTADGGYIIAGVTVSGPVTGYDVYLIKIDSKGDEQWSKTFGSSFSDGAHSVQQTTDGGYIIAGATLPPKSDKSDVYLIKTDGEGDEQWSKTFGTVGWDYANSVQQTSDGGYIIAGITFSLKPELSDMYLIKADKEGNEQWAKILGTSGVDDDANSVQQTSDSGYIIAGATFTDYTGSDDMYLVKLDSNGNEQWSKTFGGSSTDLALSVEQTSDGGYILTGKTVSGDSGEGYILLVETTSDGVEQWSKTYGGPGLDTAGKSVHQTSDGGYIIAGDTSGTMNSNDEDRLEGDVYLVKTDREGVEQWSKTYGGLGLDIAASVQLTADGGYIIVGIKIHDDSDIYVIKTDSEGNCDPMSSSTPQIKD